MNPKKLVRVGPVKVKWIKVTNVDPGDGNTKKRAFFQTDDGNGNYRYAYVEMEGDSEQLWVERLVEKMRTGLGFYYDEEMNADISFSFTDTYQVGMGANQTETQASTAHKKATNVRDTA